MSLIEQLGGYEKAKDEFKREGAYPSPNYFYYRELGFSLLQYRREHNIFEVGDHFVNHCDDCIYVVLSFNGNGHMHGKSGDKNVWTYSGRFGLRHSTPEEIQAGRRLEVCGG